ncbi:MAG: metallophosphoesterase, partial [Clostridia bacterium]|nr:metallophosphoesterase [Clostridia bacterium]
MKQRIRRLSVTLLALLLSLTLVFSAVVAFAESGAFADRAYTNLVTFSDCQSFGPGAFNNFGSVLRVMRDDGLPEPDALLVGGDYSRLLNDYATPGIIQLRDQYTAVYENGDPDDIITAQGNHDSRIPAFYPTGMYDMGTYCFYLINEDDY